MNLKGQFHITGGRILELAFKTSLGYLVFTVTLFTVPLIQESWRYYITQPYNAAAGSRFHTEKFLVIGEVDVEIEIVESVKDRVKGLSGRESLEPNTGMLFVFSRTDHHAIWMKDMLFNIDIIWLSDSLNVVHIEENVSPNTYPKQFVPKKQARYVLEVPAGFVERYGIKINDLAVLL